MSPASRDGTHYACFQLEPLTDICAPSYESLPPNFSLSQNMAAGAFAGIAVRNIRLTRLSGPCS
jgi:hypothetical protein